MIPHYQGPHRSRCRRRRHDRPPRAGGRRSRHRIGCARAADRARQAKARLIGIDSDASMLARRVTGCAARSRRSRKTSSASEAPAATSSPASFALHHIPTGHRKAAVYKRCFRHCDRAACSSAPIAISHRAPYCRNRDREAWLNHLAHLLSRGGELPEDVGEGRRLLLAGSRDRTANGSGLCCGSDVAPQPSRFLRVLSNPAARSPQART